MAALAIAFLLGVATMLLAWSPWTTGGESRVSRVEVMNVPSTIGVANWPEVQKVESVATGETPLFAFDYLKPYVEGTASYLRADVTIDHPVRLDLWLTVHATSAERPSAHVTMLDGRWFPVYARPLELTAVTDSDERRGTGSSWLGHLDLALPLADHIVLIVGSDDVSGATGLSAYFSYEATVLDV